MPQIMPITHKPHTPITLLHLPPVDDHCIQKNPNIPPSSTASLLSPTILDSCFIFMILSYLTTPITPFFLVYI